MDAFLAIPVFKIYINAKDNYDTNRTAVNGQLHLDVPQAYLLRLPMLSAVYTLETPIRYYLNNVFFPSEEWT